MFDFVHPKNVKVYYQKDRSSVNSAMAIIFPTYISFLKCFNISYHQFCFWFIITLLEQALKLFYNFIYKCYWHWYNEKPITYLRQLALILVIENSRIELQG